MNNNNKVQVVVVERNNKYNTNKVFLLEMVIYHIMHHRYRLEIISHLTFDFEIQTLFIHSSNYAKVQRTAQDPPIPIVQVMMNQWRHPLVQVELTPRNNKPKKRKLVPKFRPW